MRQKSIGFKSCANVQSVSLNTQHELEDAIVYTLTQRSVITYHNIMMARMHVCTSLELLQRL
jgi:hypothetical protein